MAMAMPTELLLQEFFKIPKISELKINIHNIGLASAGLASIAIGVSAMLGGMLFGSRGLAVGGIVASCVVAYATHRKDITAIELYAELTYKQKEQLAEKLRGYLMSKGIGDMQTFVEKALDSEQNFILDIIRILQTFLVELRMTVVQ